MAHGTVDLPELFRAVAARVSLPEKKLDQLLSSDDWTLIVQSHALTETAVNEGLSKLLPPAAATWILNNNLSFRKRLDLACELRQVPASSKAAMVALSEVRNAIVHDVGGLSFDLLSYLAADPTKRQRLERLAAVVSTPLPLTREGLRDAASFTFLGAIMQFIIIQKGQDLTQGYLTI